MEMPKKPDRNVVAGELLVNSELPGLNYRKTRKQEIKVGMFPDGANVTTIHKSWKVPFTLSPYQNGSITVSVTYVCYAEQIEDANDALRQLILEELQKDFEALKRFAISLRIDNQENS